MSHEKAPMTALAGNVSQAPGAESALPEGRRLDGPGVLGVLWVGLSLSIGWGIRGNFGHEYGAMIPGVLASVAAVLLSGRSDWHRRVLFFGFFGALGWSFGGSISYMQVIAYTHSGHSSSVLYGFACLFVIGFLWAALGGAGTALPVFLSRERLTEFFGPLTAVFIGWTLQDIVVGTWFAVDPDYRQRSPLYWYDSNWLATLVAILSVAALALARRRWDQASSLILHIAVGWWVGFLLLVVVLGLRMTPPRGDSWAGCVGMVAGMWIYFQRQGLGGLTFASALSGLFGGFGFAFAQVLKLVGIASGRQTNWHSLLEQSYGLINGIGLGVTLFWLARRAPKVTDEPAVRRWAEPYAAAFVLLVVSYVNLVKNPEQWIKARAVPPTLYGLSAEGWFNLAYAGLGLVFILLLAQHRRRGLPLLRTNWLGRGQLVYLVFLWVMVCGNFERALVSFSAERLVTEGVIFLNATLCTAGIFLSAPVTPGGPGEGWSEWGSGIKKIVLAGVVATSVSVIADWAVVRAIYGNRPAGYAARHIRFGPDATATKEKPSPALPHP